MKNLWAPWRSEFITHGIRNMTECIFCLKPREEDDEKNLILYRGNHFFVMLNTFPYNNGHLMVIPFRHVTEIDKLDDAEWSELSSLIKRSISLLRSILKPDGFNIGINLGTAAGASIDHIHVHIVPRWAWDTNFMPVLADTKVIGST